jgi:hypothetical protein
LAAITDLRTALHNTIEAEDADIDQARKNLRRCRELAIKVVKNNSELGKQLVVILDDALLLMHHAPDPCKYMKYAASECLSVIDPIQNS